MLRARFLLAVFCLSAVPARAADNDDPALAGKLKAFDAWMEKVLKDWNVPGIGVGIVVRFRVKDFSDNFVEFVVTDGRVTAFKQTDPSGEYTFPRK